MRKSIRMRSRTPVDKYDNCGKQHCVSIPVWHMLVQKNFLGRRFMKLTLEHEIAVLCRSSREQRPHMSNGLLIALRKVFEFLQAVSIL